MSDWTIAALPLLGVAFGAALQFRSSRAAERERHTETLRAQAYSDYLRAVAASRHLRCDEDLRDAHRDAADAKARIAVYGTAEVVKALARFEETGAVLSGEEAQTAFVALVSAMRSTSRIHDRELLKRPRGPRSALWHLRKPSRACAARQRQREV